MTLNEHNSSIFLPSLSANPEAEFLAATSAGLNAFLSGMAGTGKTTLLRSHIAESNHKIDVVAPTGIAALNIGGMTIHRWCGMLLGPGSFPRDPIESNEDYYDWLKKEPYASIRRGFDRVRYCKTLVIDEISMLSGRQFDFVEWLFRKLRRDDRPWGGCQVMVVGDFLQLAPVKRNDTSPYDWCFKTEAWARSNFVNVTLHKIHRQNELNFISALCGLRVGFLNERSKMVLWDRIINNPDDKIPRLYTHNVQVDKWNEDRLSNLPGEVISYTGVESGDTKNSRMLADNLICPNLLELKIGALVMTTVNHKDGCYVNGTIGIVVSADASGVRVESDGASFWVDPFTWKWGKPHEDGYAEYTQIPMRLAYAMTIHKCQGITLKAAYIDVRAAREPGQAYVALSRVRTLAGLHIKEWPNYINCSKEAVDFHNKLGGQQTIVEPQQTKPINEDLF